MFFIKSPYKNIGMYFAGMGYFSCFVVAGGTGLVFQVSFNGILTKQHLTKKWETSVYLCKVRKYGRTFDTIK